jgi:hypothetical protein
MLVMRDLEQIQFAVCQNNNAFLGAYISDVTPGTPEVSDSGQANTLDPTRKAPKQGTFEGD